jgi:hypothetical protein
MSQEERAAEIRAFTKPTRPVRLPTLARYAATAALFEEYRLRVHRNPLPADDERFLALSAVMRGLVEELGLRGLHGRNRRPRWRRRHH